MFPRTEAMKALVTEMRELGLASVRESLERACYEETGALRDLDLHRRESTVWCQARLEAAESSYVELIRSFLACPRQLEPRDVLSYRCHAAAWAIAELIRCAQESRGAEK